MADNFVGEIRVVGFNFPPKGWAACNGQLLPINQNQALFSLLGTQYGGNGTTTFALPDFQGRVAIGQGTGPGLSARVPGDQGGSATTGLTSAQMPAHSHGVQAGNAVAVGTDPTAGTFATPNISSRFQDLYQTTSTGGAGPIVSTVGGNQPHENQQHYLTMMVIIALNGIFPSRS